LDAGTRAVLEPRLGHDFSRVRIHTDERAAQAARSVGARAFTLGQDIVFAQGQYAPGTAPGQRLLAHELVHAAQQQSAGPVRPERPDVTDRAHPAEQEADAAVTAVVNGGRYVPRQASSRIIARQDAGVPDASVTAGPVPGAGPVSDAGTPDPAPTPAPGPALGSGPAGPSPQPVGLLRVEVTPEHRGHFPEVPGTGAGTHWVGVASDTAPRPAVRVVTDPAVSPTDPRIAGLVWSGRDVTPDPGNPLQAVVDRTAGERQVTATLGGAVASTTLWSVFARIRATAGPTATFVGTGNAGVPGATAGFAATIFPNRLLVASDRPRLDGGRDTPPPGGTHIPSGDPLADGADRHWDFSRKSRTRLLNPDGIALNTLVVPGDTAAQNIFAAAPWDYPATWEEGNDDRSTLDESNDPYGGAMTSADRVTLQLSHGGGVDGNTFERRLHFLEFVRLEIARTWWVVSHMFPWRVHERARKQAGQWVDDGTTAAADNGGF
jgi:hypothetical protein